MESSSSQTTPFAQTITQFITQVVIPRMNKAEDLNQRGYHYDACQVHKSTLRAIKGAMPRRRDEVEHLINTINELDSELNKNVFVNKEQITIFKLGPLNMMSKRVYEYVDQCLWDILNESDLFKLMKFSYIVPTESYPARDRPEKKKFPARLSEDLE